MKSRQFVASALVGAAAYLAQLSYPGVYVLDGNSGGNCGRIQRAVFAN